VQRYTQPYLHSFLLPLSTAAAPATPAPAFAAAPAVAPAVAPAAAAPAAAPAAAAVCDRLRIRFEGITSRPGKIRRRRSSGGMVGERRHADEQLGALLVAAQVAFEKSDWPVKKIR
jgi:hypothetical protein